MPRAMGILHPPALVFSRIGSGSYAKNLGMDAKSAKEAQGRMLRSYFRYYNCSRLHLSLDKDSPDPRTVQCLGQVIAIPQVGGLHHHYERRAA